MLCLHCQSENSHQARYCNGCEAVLPRATGLSPAPPPLGYNDEIEYLHPNHHYETDSTLELHELVSALFDGVDVFEDLDELVHEMSETYQKFDREHTQPFLQSLFEEAGQNPNDPFPHQLSYVLQTGARLFERGRQSLSGFLDSDSEDPDELERALYDLGEGHDYTFFGIELVQQRIEQMAP